MRNYSCFLLVAWLMSCGPSAVPGENGDIDTTTLPTPPATDGARETAPFVARGNEPFWRVTLEAAADGAPQLTWLTAEGDSLRTALPDPQRSDERNAVSYEIPGEITLTVLGEGCQDDMSGEPFPFVVQVIRKGQTYNGCGEYTAGVPVLNRWQLTAIDGEPLDPTAFPQGLPTLDLAGEQGRVSGLAGCNRYSGPVTVQPSQLIFGALISTKMACPNLETENRFLGALRDTVGYKLLPGYLTLQSDERELAFVPLRAAGK